MNEPKDKRLERNQYPTPVVGEATVPFDSDQAHPVNRILDARFGLVLPTERMFLYGILCALPHKFIRAVEIGTWKGTTMHVLRRACDELYCIDPQPQWLADESIKTRSGKPVRLIQGFSPQDLISEVPAPFTFVFVDGDHTTEGVYRDMIALESLMEPGGIICFHDGNHPPVRAGIEQASKEWKRNHGVHHCACDTIAETPEGVYAGITVLTVEGDAMSGKEPFLSANFSKEVARGDRGLWQRILGR